ncbi:hypothetical protein N7470_000502 [Penicillium chermesinum]|nr:hypothetical protein N7470_000502 [Penicillium chermesinum]
MRPALVRLLKRPSTLSIIETLVTNPISLDQLSPRYTSVRCHSQLPKQGFNDDARQDASRGTRSRKFSGGKNTRLPSSSPVQKTFEVDLDASQQLQIDDPVQFLRAHPERLEFESDIGHSDEFGTRLVDNPEHRNNFGLWEELLRYRQRCYGDIGSQTIWEGMTVRLSDLRLPIARDHADFLWQSFVDLGLKRIVFLDEIMRHAFDLWKDEADELHLSGIAVPGDVVKILDQAISPECLSMYQVLPGQDSRLRDSRKRRNLLKALCEKPNGIYGAVISKLLEHGHGMDALAMHSFLVQRDDHPMTIQEIQPLMDHLEKFGVSMDFEFLQPDYSSLRAYYQQLFDPVDSTNELATGSSKDSSKTTFPKDDLGARLFATRTLPFEMALGTCRLMGVSVLGPRALRELALRHCDPHDLREKLKAIDQVGISIGDCIFSRLIQRFVAENRGILLSKLLETDQHFDALEDEALQEDLLISYYMAPDWDLYNLSQAILEEHHPSEPDLWNIHFRKFLCAGDLTGAFRIVDEMAMRSKTLTPYSLELMTEKVLSSRRMQKRPREDSGISTPTQVRFVVKILKRMAPNGCHVPEKLWVELLRRLGMTRSWTDLRECCLWLVRYYDGNNQTRQSYRSLLMSKQALGRIFHHHMQAALVSWGFQWHYQPSRSLEKQYYEHPQSRERLIPFVRGILLLRELEQAGLPINLEKVRYATRLRLQQLYGYYRPSKKRANRTARRTNPFSLQHVLADIDRAWGGPFWSEESLGSQDLEALVNPKRQLLLEDSPRIHRRVPRSMRFGCLSYKRAAR